MAKLLSFCLFFILLTIISCSDNTSSTQNETLNDSDPVVESEPVVLSNVAEFEIQKSIKRNKLNLKEINSRAAAFKAEFGSLYDNLPYVTFINNQLYFYVIQGKWGNSNLKDAGSIKKGEYKMGLVDDKNTIIIPVEYDKISNMGGLAYNLIEVEKGGKYGVFDIKGNELLKAEFDALFPYEANENVWLQIKKDNSYGWLNKNGDFSFDKNSHPDNKLFSAPAGSDLIKSWSFNSQNDLFHPVFEPFVEFFDDEPSNGNGIIFTPSYLYNLGIVDEFQSDWMVVESDFGLVNSEVKVSAVAEDISGFSALWAVFKSSFLDVRDYGDELEQLIIVSEDMEPADKLKFTESGMICGSENSIRALENNLIETCQMGKNNYEYYSEMPVYRYFSVDEKGKLNKLDVKGDFPSSRTTLLTEDHLKGCFIRDVTDAEINENDLDEDYFNYAISSHLSIKDLDIMRNEIFAVHGYIFSNPDYQEYFKSKEWYKPLYENVEDKLSDIEKSNIRFLKKMTKKMAGKEGEYTKAEFSVYVAAG